VIDESPMPEKAPEPGRALRMRTPQAVSLAALLLIVITALAGTFNQKQERARVRVAGLDVSVLFTTRFRFQQTDIIAVTITNATHARVDSVRVGVDTAYMRGFAQTEMTPAPLYPFVSMLPEIPAGERREVRVEARGDRIGRHRGDLVISARGDTARIPLSTFILP
jgi:hypothetical protein